MSAQSEFIAALEAGDVALASKAAKILFPHLPQPAEHAETTLHMARTQMAEISFKKRAYSHAWLTERGLPSQLPDELKPRAQRIYPVISEAVLVSANSNSPHLKPAAKIVERAMSDAVEEAYADGKREPAFVRSRIQEARRKAWKQLTGTGVD